MHVDNFVAQATFRFHGDLTFFLPAIHHKGIVAYHFDPATDGNVAVKHAVESLGVPHTEIDQLVANGEMVGFDYALHDGDVVEVQAWIPKPDQVMLRPPLPRPVRFVADTHLGRLAIYLRLLGFDTRYRNDFDDATLAEISHAEGRVLLTRDRGLLKRTIVDFGCCVRENRPQPQLIALIKRYALAEEIAPWQRCLRCNGLLVAVDKAEILDQLAPKTRRYYDDFRRCEQCGQVYWRGSHYARMQGFIAQVLEAI